MYIISYYTGIVVVHDCRQVYIVFELKTADDPERSKCLHKLLSNIITVFEYVCSIISSLFKFLYFAKTATQTHARENQVVRFLIVAIRGQFFQNINRIITCTTRTALPRNSRKLFILTLNTYP